MANMDPPLAKGATMISEKGEWTQEQFKSMFVCQFLATWAANNYSDACMRSGSGGHDIWDRFPVEDAEHLAEKCLNRMEQLTEVL